MNTDVLIIPPNGARLAYRHTAPGFEVIEELHPDRLVYEIKTPAHLATIQNCFECLGLNPQTQGDRVTIRTSARTATARRATSEAFIFEYGEELTHKGSF